MSTSDEAEAFLAQLNAVRGVVDAIRPFVELIAGIKQAFVDGGFSEEVADLLTVEFTRAAIMPYVGPKKEDT